MIGKGHILSHSHRRGNFLWYKADGDGFHNDIILFCLVVTISRVDKTRTTLEFLGTWEVMYNPAFTLIAREWIEKTNANGMHVQSDRYGGTFGSSISPVFKLYLLKEYQRQKDEENDRLKLEWDAKCFLSKSNYLIRTDAVKNNILPKADDNSSME